MTTPISQAPLGTTMERYLDVLGAADLLLVSKATIYGWVHERRIPYRKHGGRLVFWQPDLLKWSKSQEVRPVAGASWPTMAGDGIESLRRKASSSLKTEQTKSKPQPPGGRSRNGNY